MTNSSTRLSRSEVVDLCETIHASGPLPVFGARVLGLFAGGRQSWWVRVSELVSRGGVLLGRGRGPRRDDEWCLVNPFVLGARADVIFHHDRPVAPAPDETHEGCPCKT